MWNDQKARTVLTFETSLVAPVRSKFDFSFTFITNVQNSKALRGFLRLHMPNVHASHVCILSSPFFSRYRIANACGRSTSGIRTFDRYPEYRTDYLSSIGGTVPTVGQILNCCTINTALILYYFIYLECKLNY